MSEYSWFKKTPQSCTVVVLGEVFKDRAPITTSILFGQKAYEAYQVYVYLDALMTTRHDPTFVDWSPLFCSLYAGILASDARRVIEIGSTLFATIDKLEKLSTLSGIPLPEIEFIGIEPSEFFCKIAKGLHPHSRIWHGKNISEVEPGYSVSRCYQSTSYAFESTKELIDYCAMCVFGSQGIWFSTDGTTKNVTALGKSLTLFSLPEFVTEMGARGYRVEFVANSKATKLDEFDYYETWLIYRKFANEQESRFKDWLEKLSACTKESPVLYSDISAVPLGVRKDAAFDGLDDSRVFDFTSPEALHRLEEWRNSLARDSDPLRKAARKVKGALRQVLNR